METLEFRAMNTSVLLAAEGDERTGTALAEARTFIETCEKRFSRFLPDSELSRLNRSAGDWFAVSQALMELIRLSLEFHHETDGLFDPAILPDLKRAGYDKSIDAIRQEGVSSNSNSRPVRYPTLSSVEIDATNHRVRLSRGMLLDFGGIAKGWIVEEAATLLSKASPVCAASAGGDIFFIGTPSDGSKWRVTVEDPRDVSKTAATIGVGAGAVVTSSVAKRTWNQGDKIRHHIIDPRTGEPANTNWLSVTLIASHMAEAEAFAKALLIGGETEASRLAVRRPDIAFITIDADGQLSASQNSLELLNDSYVHI